MRTLHCACFGGLLTLLLLSAGSASAQETRSLRISEGEVYIDGHRVPGTDLPASLKPGDAHVNYVFSGDAEPVIRVGENFYVLEHGRIRDAEPHERSDVSVIFRDDFPHKVQLSGVDVRLDEDAMRDASAVTSEHVAVLQRKAVELQAQAEHLQELQSHARIRFSDDRMKELERVAQDLTVRAEEAAQMAEAMPRLQVQGYLNNIQRSNQPLFNRLVDEREMERETLRLADEIQRIEDEGARTEKVEALRTKLQEIFDLKQDNRRQEIEQLELRLEDLQERLVERERMREDIVERRLHELLRSTDNLNW